MAEEEEKINQAHQANSSTDNNNGKVFNDLGFSNIVGKNRKRYINKDGTFNVVRSSKNWRQLHIYQWLVLMSWPMFFGVTVVAFFVVNSLFTGLYLLNGIEHLTGSGTEGLSPFWIGFFFSSQTLTTVGYGSISPIGFEANFIAAMGALVGLMAFALATGLLFARFSRPTANILFSENALISPYQQGKGLMFRLVNNRKNILTNLTIEVMATWIAMNEDGVEKRMYQRLELERDVLSMLPLTWTVVHPINENSPIYSFSKEVCSKIDLELIVVLEGYDDTFSNKIRSHYSYKHNELVWGERFEPAFYIDEAGDMVLEIDRLNAYKKQEISFLYLNYFV